MISEKQIEFAASELHTVGGFFGLWACYDTQSFDTKHCTCIKDVKILLNWLEEGKEKKRAVCQAKENCLETPTHSEHIIMGMMERKFNCCHSHCKCGWNDNEEEE